MVKTPRGAASARARRLRTTALRVRGLRRAARRSARPSSRGHRRRPRRRRRGPRRAPRRRRPRPRRRPCPAPRRGPPPRRSPVNKPPRSPYAQPARPAAARRRGPRRARRRARRAAGCSPAAAATAEAGPPATQKFLAAHEKTPGWYEVAAAGADARTYYAPATGASSQAPPPNAPQWYRMTDAGHPYFWHAPTGATTWNEPGGSVWRECAAPELGGRQVFVWDGVAVQGG